MTATKPPNNQLTPQTDAQSVVSSAEQRTEEHAVLSGEASAAARPAAAVVVSRNVVSPGAAAEVALAEHTAAENASRGELERLEVAERIAAFRNLQVKLRQEREKYYNAELARTRSLLAKPLKSGR